MTRFLLALACLPAFAQDPCALHDLCVTATVRTPDIAAAMFGPLKKTYSVAAVDICSQSSKAITEALGHVRQAAPLSGISILSNDEAQAVIGHAQGSTKWAKAGRIVFAVAGGAAVASGVAGIGVALKAGLTAAAILGPPIWSLASTIPVANPLDKYSDSALAEIIQFHPFGCLAKPGVQLIQAVLTLQAGASIRFGVSVPSVDQSK